MKSIEIRYGERQTGNTTRLLMTWVEREYYQFRSSVIIFESETARDDFLARLKVLLPHHTPQTIVVKNPSEIELAELIRKTKYGVDRVYFDQCHFNSDQLIKIGSALDVGIVVFHSVD